MAKKKYGIWGFGTIPDNLVDYADYYSGWLIQTNWATIEPSPGTFSWTALKADIEKVQTAGLNSAVSVWVNPSPYFPLWLNNRTYKVPLVTATNPSNTYAYYFDGNGNFKTRMLRMLDGVVGFLNSMVANNNIIFYQSSEGHQENFVPYLGSVPLSYKIDQAKFENFQKSIWSYLYNKTKVVNSDGTVLQNFDLVLNSASSDDIKNYILTNLPYAWIKRGLDGQDYGFNLESYDWAKITAEDTITNANPGQFRKRSDFTVTVIRPWFQGAYNMNSLQVIANALTKGVDILMATPQNLPSVSPQFLTDLFNNLSGQDSAIGSNKIAYLFPVSKADGSNISRFPVSTFGSVLTGGLNSSTNPMDYITKANLTRLNNIKNNIANNFLLDTTQFGVNAGGDTRYDDKLNNDIGMKIKEGPVSRFVTQPDWLREAKFSVRIGDKSKDFMGRYAYGFKTLTVGALGSEFFFKFTDDFKQTTYGASIRIWYWNSGVEVWGVRTDTGLGNYITQVTNSNTLEWKYIDVSIPIYSTGKLTNHKGDICDFSLEHISGAANSWRLGGFTVAKEVAFTAPPSVDAGMAQNISGNTATLTASATAASGLTIVSYRWSYVESSGPVTPTIASPTTQSTGVSGMTVDGKYDFDCLVTDSKGKSSIDRTSITKTTAVKPISNAGVDKILTKPTLVVSVGGSDTAPDGFSITTRQWAVAVKPAGSANPTLSAATSANTNVTFLSGAVNGRYTLGKTVTDNQGTPQQGYDEVNIDLKPAAPIITKFGILISQNIMDGAQKMTMMDNLGVTVLRTSVYAIDWIGTNTPTEAMLDRIKNDGKTVFLNVNWAPVGRNSSGDKVPNHFVTGDNLTKYLNALNRICAKYKSVTNGGIIEGVSIENEPLTKNFYYETDPIENYIDQVAQAIPVAHSNGCSITCGGVHIPFQLLVKKAEINGTLGSLTGRDLKAKKIIWAYSNEWADIDYVNTHCAVAGNDAQAGAGGVDDPAKWAEAFDYMRQKSGKSPMCNEWGIDSVDPTLLGVITAQQANSNIAFGIIYSGQPNSTGDHLPLNGTNTNPYPSPNLNSLGISYRDTVAKY